MQKPPLSNKREMFFNPAQQGGGGGGAPNANSTVAVNGTAEPRVGKTVAATEGDGPDPPIRFRDGKNVRAVDGYVGFANLPNQVYRKAVKKGFEFTLMVVGESGSGKSTLINSMFLTDIYCPDYPGPSHRIKKTGQVETTKVLLKENGVNLSLTVVDTPGFGDSVDNSNCWNPILDYVENKYEEFLNGESRVNRRTVADGRVHCCVYFIAASGHGLKPLDVEFMRRLHDKVNIIPVVAKADTMTPEESTLFKKTILNEIAQNKIKIYEFPDCDDEEGQKVQKQLKERVPFAVVGSNTVIDVGGKKVRGRKYPWGVVEVENLEHCDFIALRNMIIRTHMQDLKEVTNNVHYENFRCRKLAGLGPDGKAVRLSGKNPLAQMEEEKREHDAKMKKMEEEMEHVFEMKVKEKKQRLKDSEADVSLLLDEQPPNALSPPPSLPPTPTLPREPFPITLESETTVQTIDSNFELPQSARSAATSIDVQVDSSRRDIESPEGFYSSWFPRSRSITPRTFSPASPALHEYEKYRKLVPDVLSSTLRGCDHKYGSGDLPMGKYSRSYSMDQGSRPRGREVPVVEEGAEGGSSNDVGNLVNLWESRCSADVNDTW